MEALAGSQDRLLLVRLSEYLSFHTGLYFPPERLHDMERGAVKAAREFGFQDLEAFTEWLLSSPLDAVQIEALAECLTVGETYFFREMEAFEALERTVLPELLESRKKEKYLRIWSAGCSTGEEPYSIAMLLHRAMRDLADWNITILATDINRSALEKAARGLYREWSFRETPEWVKSGYFFVTGDGRYELAFSIRKMVTFAFHNLAEDPYPSLLNNTNAHDIIFCRNVLMYFAPETISRSADRLCRSLVEGGWLFTGVSEVPHMQPKRTVTVKLPGTTGFKRASATGAGTDGTESRERVRPAATLEPGRKADRGRVDSRGAPMREPGSEKTGRPVVPLEEEAKSAKAAAGAAGEAKALLERASAAYELGLYTEAASELDAALQIDPGNIEATILKARTCANRGDLAAARVLCVMAIAADKLNPVCHYLLATVFQEQGEPGEAIKSLKRAIYLEPAFVLAHFALGNLLSEQGKRGESEKYLANALTLLERYRKDEVVRHSEGVTAGRLAEVIDASTGKRPSGG